MTRPTDEFPLKPFAGAHPDAPEWFRNAIEAAPEREMVTVEGARIETLAWGEAGKPGLLFLHGNGAHADWWSFIAPLLAADYRVVAVSSSGNGASDRRERYSIELFADEALAAAEVRGLFEAPTTPVFIGHSFGGFPVINCAARAGRRLRAAVVMDTPLMSREQRQARRQGRRPTWHQRPHRVYPTVADALARFRLVPPQPCDNLFIADHIARKSLVEVEGGFAWRFDPNRWRDFDMGHPVADLAAAQCPVAFMWGGRSALKREEIVAHMRDLAPAGSPFIDIPEAHHHLMIDQPLAVVAALRALLAAWPAQDIVSTREPAALEAVRS